MMFWKKQLIPRWAEQRILDQYEQAIRDVERCRRSVKEMSAAGETPNLRRYSYVIGKVAAYEELMDRLFIEYDDNGRVPELPI